MTNPNPADLGIAFKIMGIAEVLAHNNLTVPLNQRSYAWENEHVERLLEDLSAQMNKNERTYFLGTIVLAHDDQGNLVVADGQQRLATTSILIAAIRDYLWQTDNPSDKKTAEKYQRRYLLEYDEDHDEDSPKLYLNAMDRDYFAKAILAAPDDPSRKSSQELYSSHERLTSASRLSRKHVENITLPLPKGERTKWLIQWIKFLETKVVIIAITVPKDIDAFKMFETLNDRGLRASQVDILKSHLFYEAQDKLVSEVQPSWASMVSTVEAVGDDELVLSYVRHFWIARQGPTTEDELAKSFKDHVSGRKQAIQTVAALQAQAHDYVALLTPLEHPSLEKFGKDSRAYLKAITGILRIVQIRPLLLAIIQKFSPAEARRAFEMCLSWSVRFLVVGGAGGGVLERYYGLRAKEVFQGEVKTAKELAEKMGPVVPDDGTFEQAFRIHQVSKKAIGRYYLHSLENFKRQEDKPQIGYFEMPESSTSLEHVMPDHEADGWNIPLTDAQANYKRVGNMTLLSTKQNSDLGDAPFSEKKKVYADSTFLLTQEIAETKSWGPKEIEARQMKLALIAPKVWPL